VLRDELMMIADGRTTDTLTFLAGSVYSFMVLPCLAPLPFMWHLPSTMVQVGHSGGASCPGLGHMLLLLSI
jgi:hypothetical protein